MELIGAPGAVSPIMELIGAPGAVSLQLMLLHVLVLNLILMLGLNSQP